MQGAEVLPVGTCCIGGACTLLRALVVFGHDGIDLRVQRFNPGDTRINELCRADLAALQQRETLRSRPIAQLVHGVLIAAQATAPA